MGGTRTAPRSSWIGFAIHCVKGYLTERSATLPPRVHASTDRWISAKAENIFPTEPVESRSADRAPGDSRKLACRSESIPT